MKTLLLVLLLVAPLAAAQDYLATFEAPLPAATPASMYSFADVYRLTVGGAALGSFASNPSEAQVRVASQTLAAPEPRFSVSSVPPPEKWLLLLAGLALAGWVAHRRLARPF